MFKINDKVKVIKCKPTKCYERTYGAEGTVVSVLRKYYKYAVKFEDIKNPNSQHGYFYFTEGDLKLVSEKYTSIQELIESESRFMVHTPTIQEAEALINFLCVDSPISGQKWLECWKLYGKDTGYLIIEGQIEQYGNCTIMADHNVIGTVYEFSKLSFVDYKTPSKRNMSTIFTTTEGTRERKLHEKGKPRIVDTISTTVKTDLGEATTTCDKSDYYDVYTGALVASAKLTASRSEEAMLLYKTAMDMWGNEMCTSILKALANRAFGDDKFDWVYKKWSKSVAQVEREKDKKTRTCSVCGQVFKTSEEARTHEKWHRDCKLRREELKEARRRLRDSEREANIESFMKELKDKKNSKKKNSKKPSNK